MIRPSPRVGKVLPRRSLWSCVAARLVSFIDGAMRLLRWLASLVPSFVALTRKHMQGVRCRMATLMIVIVLLWCDCSERACGWLGMRHSPTRSLSLFMFMYVVAALLALTWWLLLSVCSVFATPCNYCVTLVFGSDSLSLSRIF